MSGTVLHPDWPAPANVRALVTTRAGGVSRAPYATWNLATHVGDDPTRVAENRSRLRADVPAEPLWLEQVHGTAVCGFGTEEAVPCGDASVAHAPGQVCVVLTADCLPVLFCDRAGTVVAAAHAGWRGLLAGVLEQCVRRMGVAPGALLAWLGPAIGPSAFEVGDEVRAAFLARDERMRSAFVAGQVEGKWFADLYALARMRLAGVGLVHCFGGEFCTYTDRERFFSYRRDGVTGRMASLVWLAGDD